mmetsp:Transcript_26757/g.63454  ORF Transcript_26757/g.63454 Transcript_26757/m.63454 type:complete len:200 (-) Transcript_26757:55-654(-)
MENQMERAPPTRLNVYLEEHDELREDFLGIDEDWEQDYPEHKHDVGTQRWYRPQRKHRHLEGREIARWIVLDLFESCNRGAAAKLYGSATFELLRALLGHQKKGARGGQGRKRSRARSSRRAQREPPRERRTCSTSPPKSTRSKTRRMPPAERAAAATTPTRPTAPTAPAAPQPRARARKPYPSARCRPATQQVAEPWK